jgi:serine/threonine-protein kinase Chk2
MTDGVGPTQLMDDLPQSAEQTQDVNKPRAWGRLISLDVKKSPNIDMDREEVWFGRHSSCSQIFGEPGISAKHCRIYRERIGSETYNHLVWIEDTSTNGTFLNNDVIGKGKKKLLESGSTVHLLKATKTTDPIGFIFQDNREDQHESEEGGPQKDYDVREVLGTGNFATVKLAIHKKSGEKFAIKIIDKKKFLLSNATKRKNALMDEVFILKQVDHKNIIHINDVYETPTKLFLVLELVTGGELFDKIVSVGSFSEAKAKELFRQMLDAVGYLHNQGIAHRDLKPENILLKSKEDDTIKLSDFGLSRVMNEDASKMKTMCGTPQYVAPEILTEADNDGYSKACDLWSLGVILYIMLVGYPPFNETKSKSLFEQIKTADFDYDKEFWSKISDEVKDFIVHLLTVDPNKRYNVQQALDHPWMKGEKMASVSPLVAKKKGEAVEEDEAEEEENGDSPAEEAEEEENGDEDEDSASDPEDSDEGASVGKKRKKPVKDAKRPTKRQKVEKTTKTNKETTKKTKPVKATAVKTRAASKKAKK